MPHFNIAIVDSNILAALGLQPLLTDLIPVAEVHIFISFDELRAVDQGQFVHYFVASGIYFEHAAYFREKARRSIVLVNGDLQIAGVPTLNVCQSEQALVKSILSVHRKGHPQMENVKGQKSNGKSSSAWAGGLSSREVEVAILLAKGHINKEIADLLHISLTTVITHRKNIMEKLGFKSVSALTIYAVMHGYVDINKI